MQINWNMNSYVNTDNTKNIAAPTNNTVFEINGDWQRGFTSSSYELNLLDLW
jgi:hypothetical protein